MDEIVIAAAKKTDNILFRIFPFMISLFIEIFLFLAFLVCGFKLDF